MCFLSQCFMKSVWEKGTECQASGELTGFDTDVMKHYLCIYSAVPGVLKLFSSHGDSKT